MTNVILALSLIERGIISISRIVDIIKAIKEERDLSNDELIVILAKSIEAHERLQGQGEEE